MRLGFGGFDRDEIGIGLLIGVVKKIGIEGRRGRRLGFAGRFVG